MMISIITKKGTRIFSMLSFCLFVLWGEISAQDISPRYEFRGAWIATVDNIDWPSRKGLPVDSQKAEYIRILELHKLNGMNAVIMQIRPAADAFYPSSFEPWSEWLTGVQGKPPSPYYD
ncbi:MAG: family 10 glycosylhydrolase, partial [Chitinophagaceae bacterium]